MLKKDGIIRFIALTILFALGVTSLAVTDTATVYFGGSTRKIPVYAVDREQNEEKLIALTFDAAWGADKTQGILDIMNEYGFKGTFFLVGFWLDKYPEMVKKIHKAGFDIGNHSKNHLNMPKLHEDEIKKEIESVNEQIVKLTGQRPRFFRAPFGDYSNRLMTVLEEEKMQGIQWSIDSLDWKGLSAKEITQRVLPKAKNGDIVLFHNNSDHILDALPFVLQGLKANNFKVVPLSKLVLSENCYTDANGIQRKK